MSAMSSPSRRDDVDRRCHVSARLGVEVEVRDGELSVRGDRQSERHSTELRSIVRASRRSCPGRATSSTRAASRRSRPRPASRRRRRRRPLPGVDVGLDERADPLVAERAQRRLLAPLGQPLVDRLAGPLQGAVDRRRRSCRASPRPRAAEKPSTSRRISTARCVAGRCCSAATKASSTPRAARSGRPAPATVLERRASRPGTARARPPRRAARRRRRAGRRRAVVDRQHALRAPRDRVQARVGRDPVEPGAQRAAALEPRQAAPRAQQRLLQRVLGVVERAEHPVAVRVQLAAMRLDERPKASSSPAARGVEQLVVVQLACRCDGHLYEVRPLSPAKLIADGTAAGR